MNLANINWKKGLNKAIIISLYIFALSTFTSKGLASLGGGFAIIFWLVLVLIKNKNYNFRSTPLDKPIIVFAIGILITGATNIGDSDIYLLTIVLFYVIVNTVRDIKHIKRLIYITMISMGLATTYGFYQHYHLNMGRIVSFMSSLAFGGVLATILMFTLTYIIWGQTSYRNKALLILSSILMGMALIFTKTRGAWLGFIGGLTSIGWLKDKRIVAVFIILIIAISFVLPQTYINRFKSSFYLTKYKSNTTRIALWQTALEMFKDNPLTGVGIGRYSIAYENNYKQPNLRTFDHVHNNFLQFLAEGGLIVFIPFCWLMLKIFMLLYKGYNHIYNHKWQLFILASLGAFIVFNIQGLTQCNFEDTETIRFFWYLTALDVIIVSKFSDLFDHDSEINETVITDGSD